MVDGNSNSKRQRSKTQTIDRQEILDNIVVKRSAFLEVSGLRVDLEKGIVPIGSDPQCAVHLPMEGVSSIHCRICYRGEQYHLEDLRSTNGTYLNNLKIERGVLRSGDKISVGTVKIVFREKQED